MVRDLKQELPGGIKGCNVRRKNERIQNLEPQVLTIHICSLPICFTALSLQVACLLILVR